MDSILHLFLAFASVAVPIQGRLFNATITSNVFVAIAEIDTDLVPVFTPSAGEQIILGETYTIHIDESHSGGIRGIYLCSVIDDTHFYMLDKNGGDLDDPDTISPYYTPLGNGSYKWLVPVVPTGQYVLLPQNNQAVYGISPYFWLEASPIQSGPGGLATAAMTTQSLTNISSNLAGPTETAISTTLTTVGVPDPPISPAPSSTTQGTSSPSSSVLSSLTSNQTSGILSPQTTPSLTSQSHSSGGAPSVGVIVGSICALIAILAAVMIWLLCFARNRRQPYGLDLTDSAPRYRPVQLQIPDIGEAIVKPTVEPLPAQEQIGTSSSEAAVALPSEKELAELPTSSTGTELPAPRGLLAKARIECGKFETFPESPVVGVFDPQGRGTSVRGSDDKGPFELPVGEI